MPVPAHLAHRSIYHFTHLDNLAGILEHGLLAKNEKDKASIPHIDIAYSGIQERRSNMPVPCGPRGAVHNYVPLYFCKRSPMLHAVIYNKIVDEQFVIYLEFPITIANTSSCVFSHSSANTAIAPKFSDDLATLDLLNWSAIDTWKWAAKHDIPGQVPIRQQKMAELLIHKEVDLSLMTRIVVWHPEIRRLVREKFDEYGVDCPPIVMGDREYYFFDRETESVPPVTGPYFIARALEETVKKVKERLGTSRNAKFQSLDELLKALRADLKAVPETAELVGLESDNEMHTENVGAHTLRVVEELRKTSEFSKMNGVDKLTVEVAAYLHDIGKGPKSRWTKTGGRQQVDPDHPIKALPMVERILIEDIAEVSPNTAKNICKLVCYHDLIGDIVGKGRREEELEAVARTDRQLQMLIAIAKADMRSVNPSWESYNRDEIDALRQRAFNAIKAPDTEDE